MTDKDYLSLALNAGRIMLENGAETYRIEDTMMRILNHLNVDNSNVFVTTTGLFASTGTETMICRVKTRTINLNKIACVNDLSRRLVNNEINAEAAVKLLADIDLIKPYNSTVKIIVTALSCLCFTFIFGGNIYDCITSFVVGIVLSLLLIFSRKRNTSDFLTSIFGGVCVAFLTLVLLNIGFGKNMDKIIIGSIMPLVPGVGLTNSIRDILEGDYLSGSGRILDAVLVATAVAAGVGTTLKLWFYCFGGVIF